jgi:hypothetical protein
MALVLVHLSDIHFQKRRIDGGYDVDQDVRNELELDLEVMRRDVGVATGVVVTGDIAFAADAKEYEAAVTWLARICDVLGCPGAAVWTVPGNHDVDRAIIDRSETVQALHDRLRADVARLERIQRDAIGAKALFEPVAAYNDFAAKYTCEVGPERLAWHADLPLNDGSRLRLCGLNSALASSRRDDEDPKKLVVGDVSHALQRAPGVAYVSLCHHPPDWLVDHDAVEDLLNARATLQLFGHKHTQRLQRINDALRVTAGAVHPDRAEKRWEPRYNVIWCAVRTEGAQRFLDTTVHARVWHDGSRRFGADTVEPLAGRMIPLPLAPWTPPPAPPAPAHPGVAPIAPAGPVPEAETSPPPRVPAMDPDRRLTYRFLTLPFHVRVELANVMDLLQDEDKGVPDRVLFQRLFKRAAERGLLARLWTEVESRHAVPAGEPNPYA